ncbi:MAG TPA: hypothetical protein VLA24_04685 [Pseudomonadales bacterium]|nr:hypothetical protein [Pseudomonadales bacterium]
MHQFLNASLLSALLISSLPAAAYNYQEGDQINISGNENRLNIQLTEANGKTMKIELDMDESTSGEVARAVLERLKEKGVVTETSDGENFNVAIHSKADLDGLQDLDLLQSLKLLKGLEILQELQALKDMNGSGNISINIDIESEKTSQ